jgi:release factor glutamine methyltransferase
MKNLVEGGYLFFEINEYLGAEMKLLLKSLGFSAIEVKKDINGKDRMLVCQKRENNLSANK